MMLPAVRHVVIALRATIVARRGFFRAIFSLFILLIANEWIISISFMLVFLSNYMCSLIIMSSVMTVIKFVDV